MGRSNWPDYAVAVCKSVGDTTYFCERETFAGIPWNEVRFTESTSVLKIESGDKAEGVASYVSSILALIKNNNEYVLYFIYSH